ncbi:pentatricopeptide repeat-containing protein At5g27110-like [Selaginella moellendorffii]|uniref:pentatricopeptide repeat-containing protein At5g27110-like n=1 Tax=Selaginella moellendorffii TaxID=88036 RepID=UPI000D1CDD8A|nr:pentatricopeptide repeat-containing protein At5g27110-like [Selaginella moellendorffii]|eukprot:XP_024521323.1 pentatricopeptide repeat-containing protein At5g27110-like [Selaginella moellendorffii]
MLIMVAANSCWNLALAATSSIFQYHSSDADDGRIHTVVRRSRNKMTKKRELLQRKGRISKEEIGLEQLLRNPDTTTYAILLRRCGRARALAEGKRVHAQIFKTGHDRETRLRNLLIQMYGECGSLIDARKVFDRTPDPNIFSWNIMLAAYAHNGHSNEALVLSQRMKDSGATVVPDRVTYVILLHACSNLGALREGRMIHASVIASGMESNVVVATAIVNMYGKCGSMGDAKMVFDKMPAKDVICWNSMISAYALNGLGKSALDLYARMRHSCVRPDAGTFVAALDACSVLNSLEDGKKIHAAIAASKLEWNVMVATALVSMYGKCGCLERSIAVFRAMEVRNLISWTAMLGALAHNGRDAAALELFARMRDEGVRIDAVAMTIALDACSRSRDFTRGREIHAMIDAAVAGRSLRSITPVLAAAIVNMYACCDEMDLARAIVARQREALLWNALIAAYTARGHPREGLRLYAEMILAERRGAPPVRPDRNTFAAVLEACGSIGAAALGEGRMIHTQAIARACNTDAIVASALIAMYSKCGSLGDAVAIFRELSRKRSVVLVTTMIAAYGHHGKLELALELFWEMAQRGLKPNRITFVSLLSSCSAANSLREAVFYFQIMIHDCDIQPGAEHYHFLIDLLGRSGKVAEAEELINSMPFAPGCGAWMSLLAACERHSKVELGRRAADRVFEMEPKNALAYLMLGKIYVAAGMWDELLQLKKLMEDRGLKREPSGSSSSSSSNNPPTTTTTTTDYHHSSLRDNEKDPLTLRPPAYILGPRP